MLIVFIMQPQQAPFIAGIILLLIYFVNLSILIVTLEDEAIRPIRILTVWVACYIGYFAQHRYLNMALTILFLSLLAYEIARTLNSAHLRRQMEHDLLKRSRNVVFSMLGDISTSGKNIPSLDYTIIRILETILDTLSVKGAAVYTFDSADNQRLRFVQSAGIFWTMHEIQEVAFSHTSFSKEELIKKRFSPGEGIVGTVAQTMQPCQLSSNSNLAAMQKLGINPGNIQNILAVPLSVKDKKIGVLVVQNRRDNTPFSENDLGLLQSLADQAAIPINNFYLYTELEKTQRLRNEMDVAAKIQLQLLPQKLPKLNHLTLAAFMDPAREVGGDYYDFFPAGPLSQGIVIGDVSGKGLPAGITMIVAKTALQLVTRRQHTAQDIIIDLCAEIYPRMQRAQFMTLNYLIWSDETLTLDYAGAGHEHILVYRSATRTVDKFKAGGLALGLLDDCRAIVRPGRITMTAGDIFLLYTDGVTEARNKDKAMFTLPRLLEVLCAYAQVDKNPQSIADKIKLDLFNFMAGYEQFDDITLMVGTVV